MRDKLPEYTAAKPALEPVQADVAAFYTLCDTARTKQQGGKGNLGELRTQREAQRIVTMNAYMGIVYGGLLQQFYTNLQIVGDYIDFPLLYDLVTEELIEEVELTTANSVVNVPLDGIAVNAAKRFRITVSNAPGVALVAVYFGATNTDNPGTPPRGLTLSAGENRTATAAELGFEATHTFLNLMSLVNTDLTVQLYEVV